MSWYYLVILTFSLELTPWSDAPYEYEWSWNTNFLPEERLILFYSPTESLYKTRLVLLGYPGHLDTTSRVGKRLGWRWGMCRSNSVLGNPYSFRWWLILAWTHEFGNRLPILILGQSIHGVEVTRSMVILTTCSLKCERIRPSHLSHKMCLGVLL